MKSHILIVDDHQALLAVLMDYLALNGFEVTIASDGSMAQRALSGATFDVAVMDIAIGELDGLELLSEVKKAHPALPVIMITGMRPYAELAVEALSRGASGFIHKCAPPEELLREINRVLQLKPNPTAEGAPPTSANG